MSCKNGLVFLQATLRSTPMIPKKIHYFWFGKGEKTELAKHCIETWRIYNPDFEIIEWTEENFDVTQNIFVKEAYEQKKWAFVSDFARSKILYEHGGFYLDTDMEVNHSLAEFTKYRAVCGFEMRHVPFSAFFAVEKNHPFAKDMVAYYEKQKEFKIIPNTAIFSKLLVEKYGADATKDCFQQLKEGIALFPSEYFSLDLPKNFVTHHFAGSWHGAWENVESTYKNMVNTYGLMHLFSRIPKAKEKVKNVVYNHKSMEIDEVLDQIPLEYIAKYLRRKAVQKIAIK